MKRDVIRQSIIILALIGVALAVYLLYEQWMRPLRPFCSLSSTINCDPIISGPLAHTFGIPTPLYGLVGYAVILLAALYRKTLPLIATAAFGVLFCLWIGYRELIGLGVVCPVCLACQVDMLAVFILSIALKRRQSTVSFTSLKTMQ
ncbi:MAG: hypothetical protein RLZZ416_775 [Candidatus Parcubacteria bacterium]|jgi:uncharacterized membrane protein